MRPSKRLPNTALMISVFSLQRASFSASVGKDEQQPLPPAANMRGGGCAAAECFIHTVKSTVKH